MIEHLQDHYAFYGQHTGVRTARKHIGWYLSDMPDSRHWLDQINRIENCADQLEAITHWFQECELDQPYLQ